MKNSFKKFLKEGSSKKKEKTIKSMSESEAEIKPQTMEETPK